MFKIVGFTIAFTLLCLGIWEIGLFFQYPGKSPDWKIIDGWLIEVGAETKFDLPGKKMQGLSLLIEDQHAVYVYFVDKAMYYKRQDLPPNLAPVHAMLEPKSAEQSSAEQSPADVGTSSDKENAIGTALDTIGMPSSSRPLARLNEKTNRLEILTDPGTMIQTNYATNYMGAKFKELPPDEWSKFLPRIKIKYNPANPNESITDPDILRGAPTLLWTGVTLIAAGVLAALAIMFHAWVMRSSESEPEINPARRRY